MRRALLLEAILGIALSPALATEAWACATCACGDPTLTVMGVEQPFAGRLRISAGFEHRSESMGSDPLQVSEERLSLAASYAILDQVQLSLTLPLLRKSALASNLARDTVYNLGDLDVRARFVLFRDREVGAHHLLTLSAGAELPTTPRMTRAGGHALPLEVQAGSASFDPLLGLSYGYFDDPWSFYASSTLLLSTEGRFELRSGPTLLGTLAAQHQLFDGLGLRLGVDLRGDGSARVAGVVDPDTGGFIAFVSPELIVSPIDDLVLRAYLRWPVYAQLEGAHEEGPMFGVGVSHDL